MIAYKPQGVKHAKYATLDDDVFLLIIMTEFQAKLFEEFSERMVCIDTTHKTNEYKFKLITVLVIDEYFKGTCTIHRQSKVLMTQ